MTTPTFSYQWVSDDGTNDADISGATESTYWPSASDVGKTIKVKVTFNDDEDNAEELTSDATDTVAGAAVTAVPADWSLTPDGLGTGERFRLIFVSSATRNATPTDIATYNTWIQDQVAAGHADIQEYSSDFRVVGSTADVDARDNTGTTYTSSDKGVPIYWLNGDKAADEYEDFYDETWDEEASMRTEAGTTVAAPAYVLTGSTHEGTEYFLGALGGSTLRAGAPNSNAADSGPISGYNVSNTDIRPFYGLSGVFSVSPPGEIVYSAVLTVEEDIDGADTYLGFDLNNSQGSLDPPWFSYDGNIINLAYLVYLVGEDLYVEVGGHSHLGSGSFNLYLDGAAFLIDDPASNTANGRFEFSNHGLSWTNGEIVRVWLTENRGADAHHQRNGPGRADPDRRDRRTRRAARRRPDHLPVDSGRWHHRDRHLRRNGLHLHPGGRRRGQDHQGRGELHRQRQLRGVVDQRRHGNRHDRPQRGVGVGGQHHPQLGHGDGHHQQSRFHQPDGLPAIQEGYRRRLDERRVRVHHQHLGGVQPDRPGREHQLRRAGVAGQQLRQRGGGGRLQDKSG